MEYRAKIERLLAERKIKRTEFARALGTQARWVTDLLDAGKEPGIFRAMNVARTLGVPVAWLFDDAQDWPPPTAENTFALSADEQIAFWMMRKIGIDRAIAKLMGEDALPAQPADPTPLTPTGPLRGVPTDASPAEPPRRGKGRRGRNDGAGA